MGRKSLKLLGVALFVLGLPVWAMADSISPSTFTGSGPTGASYTVNKTVTISAGAPTTSKVDVFFLADSTGSMGGAIANIKASATSILSSASGLGDVAFGVGEYKDVGDTFVYRTNTNISASGAANVTAAQAGINLWGASGGGDTPEANLYALQQVASTTAWRTGSARILVWFGDAPGHDPSGPTAVTEAQATAALQASNVKVEALNVGFGGLNSTGQAGRIATATGGTLFSGISDADIVAAITAAITSAFDTYTTVSLDTSEVPAGVGISVTPGSYTGSFDRSIDRTFGFEVTFTDREPGTHVFNIYAAVDGGRVATESDSITSTTGVPEPGLLILLGAGLASLAGLRRKIK